MQWVLVADGDFTATLKNGYGSDQKSILFRTFGGFVGAKRCEIDRGRPFPLGYEPPAQKKRPQTYTFVANEQKNTISDKSRFLIQNHVF